MVEDANEPKFRRRAEARPDEVLDAALDLFVANGYARTRVEDIARAAGLSKGAVYLYFPSKEAIIEALVRRALAPLADSALGVFADFEGDPRPLVTMVAGMAAQRLADPGVRAVPGLIMREVTHFPHLAQMYRREVLDRVMPAIRQLIAGGIKGGYLRPVDPDLTVRSIIGPIMLHLVLAEVFDVVPEGGLDLERFIENHLRILFDGLALPATERGVRS